MVKNRTVWAGVVVGMLGVSVSLSLAEIPYYANPVWSRQIGTSRSDRSFAAAVDSSGNVYITGWTQDVLFGGNAAGNPDVFLAKYDSQGNLLWGRQVGTNSHDEGRSVAVDASGNVYISGYTSGSLFGTHAGQFGEDPFLCKYDSQGNLLWGRQIGTASCDGSHSVAVDASGNAYISGYTWGSLGGPNAGDYDAFLVKFDSQGNQLWSRQIGTSGNDRSFAVAVDSSGNAYISGYVYGSLGGPNAGDYDAFLAKYDSQGNHLWSQQIGTTGYDYGFAMAVDSSGNAYLSGYTNGSLGGTNAGSDDIFLCKYDVQGNLIWSRQIGTSGLDRGWSVAVDASDDVYISGHTSGNLGGTYMGAWDVFLVKYDSLGTHLWSRQIGTGDSDYGYAVAVDALGNAYISGYVKDGSLGGPNAGCEDVFLSKFAARLPGDANLDGTVDDVDQGILSANYGTTSGATWSMGDFNGDGAVDVGDLGILSAHYGESIY